MAVKTIIFCDICNRDGRMSREERRTDSRSTSGRRIGDGRAWLEGGTAAARANGWHIDEHQRHICGRCYKRGLHRYA